MWLLWSPSISTPDKLDPEEIFDSNSEAVVLIRVYNEESNMVSLESGVNIHPVGVIFHTYRHTFCTRLDKIRSQNWLEIRTFV